MSSPSRKQWAPLLVWTFRGPRFEADGLDLRDLEELTRLRALLIELAKDIWKKDQARKQAPAHEVELRFFGTERGSCVVPVFYAPPPPPGQAALFADEVDERSLVAKLPQAAKLLSDALIHARTQAGSVPPTFTREMTRALLDLGSGLGAGESFEIALPTPTAIAATRDTLAVASPTFIGAPDREELAAVARTVGPPAVGDAGVRSSIETLFTAASFERRTLTGEVTMASVRGRAGLAVGRRDIALHFDPAHEHKITQALHEHSSMRLRVRGMCELDDRGRIVRVNVEEFRLVPAQVETDEERFVRMASKEPDELLALLRSARLPTVSLTFAAEAAGRVVSEKAVPVLLKLLQSPSPIVREGVVYGLSEHLRFEGVRDALVNRAGTDESPGVRAALAAVLEEGD